MRPFSKVKTVAVWHDSIWTAGDPCGGHNCSIILGIMTSLLLAVLALQIGYCGPIKDIDAAKTAGFDYFELRTLRSQPFSTPITTTWPRN